jgi:hypothetical protein
MSHGVRRQAPPCVTCTVEMFSHVTVAIDGQPATVQLLQSWWIYEDGTSHMAVRRVDDPMCGTSYPSEDPAHGEYLLDRARVIWELAQAS